MSLIDTRVLLTGASSGIGLAVAKRIAAHGARLALVGRDAERLDSARQSVVAEGTSAVTIVGDLLAAAGVDDVADSAIDLLGGVDVIVNCAGVNAFTPFDEESADAITRAFRVNVIAPMQLVRRLLPAMRTRGSGHVVNVGSTFGSIGFPYFATYSATKFALRGFSEALRRELDGSGVRVTYVAPRATRTPMAADTDEMARAVGMNVDEPAWVADRIVEAIDSGAKDCYLGFPEKLFVRVNGVLPRVVDGALRKQAAAMKPFAEKAARAAEGV